MDTQAFNSVGYEIIWSEIAEPMSVQLIGEPFAKPFVKPLSEHFWICSKSGCANDDGDTIAPIRKSQVSAALGVK